MATVADNREQCATVSAVASVFLVHSLGRVPEGSAPIFRHTRVSLLHSVKYDQVSLCAKNATSILLSVLTKHRLVTDTEAVVGHMAHTALAYALRDKN